MNDREILTIPPQIELLQWLARGSLKQNLARALRLWVGLRLLYGDREIRLDLPHPFTFPDWRDALFTDDHPTSDRIPTPHSPDCPCQRSTREWLQMGIDFDFEAWQRSLWEHLKITPDALEDILDRPLFAVTRRSLQTDLYHLHELDWLQRDKRCYSLVTKWPDYATFREMPVPIAHSLSLSNLDLYAIAANLTPTTDEPCRFFFHLDYVVGKNDIDRVEDLCVQLKELWRQTPIPPIRLTYISAKLQKTIDRVVYPVCIYYTYRALYLCTYGETPKFDGNWCHYRLDRITRIVPLTWQDSDLPLLLRDACKKGNLPAPEQVESAFLDAWGFYFYNPAEMLILRFEERFHDDYIKRSQRHNTFERLSYEDARQYILQHCRDRLRRQYYQTLLATRSPRDAYYRALYRVDDVNILHRLRSWRPKAEVLWPWDLREQMREEVNQEIHFYPDPEDL
ncbi:MAG: TIGR03985 family CRISPR-associated protein [Spirulina sp.]